MNYAHIPKVEEWRSGYFPPKCLSVQNGPKYTSTLNCLGLISSTPIINLTSLGDEEEIVIDSAYQPQIQSHKYYRQLY